MHRIPSGARYTFSDGVVRENNRPIAIYVRQIPVFLEGRTKDDPVDDLMSRRTSPFPPGTKIEWIDPPKWVDPAWPTPASLGQPWRTPNTPFPAFVPPERPAEPVEPAPAPEPAAVVTLRRLLADRQRVLRAAEYDVKGTTADIEDLEEQLADRRKDLAHEETVVEAARVEINHVIDSIRALGGKVEEA